MNLRISLGRFKSNGRAGTRRARGRRRFLNALVAGRMRTLPRTPAGRGSYGGLRIARAAGLAAVTPLWQPAGVRVLAALRSPRLFSLALLAVCLSAFAYSVNSADFYVTAPEITGRQMLSAKEIYRLTGAPGLHLFWVNPAAMEQALLASPAIRTAHVTAGWPNHVRVAIEERTPVAIWRQGGAQSWVAGDGRLMPARGALPGALTIVVEDQRPLAEGTKTVPATTVQAALALRALRPNIAELHYFERGGLAYNDGRGWQAFFGTGDDMAQKLVVYETLVDQLLKERGLQPGRIEYIVVTDVRHPFYKVRD